MPVCVCVRERGREELIFKAVHYFCVFFVFVLLCGCNLNFLCLQTNRGGIRILDC